MSFPGFPAPPGPGTPPSPSTHEILSATHSDTIAASGQEGDIIAVLSPSGSWQRVPVGAEGQILTVMMGVPAWENTSGSGLGDVTGPSGAVPNSIAIYNGSTGKIIKDSLVIITDTGDINIGGDIFGSGDLTILGDSNIGGNSLVSGDLTVLGDTTLENTTINGDLTVLGNIINSGVVINSTVTATGVTFNVANAFYNALASGVTNVNMPAAPSGGQTHILKDIAGIAGSANITISGNGNTIDGQATTLLANNYESVSLIFGPTEWNII